MNDTGGFINSCPHCGGFHAAVCPRIKRIRYSPDGRIAEVEYVDPYPVTPLVPELPLRISDCPNLVLPTTTSAANESNMDRFRQAIVIG